MENFSAKTETVLFVLTLWVLNWRIPPVASTTMVYEPTTSYETETSNSSAEHKVGRVWCISLSSRNKRLDSVEQDNREASCPYTAVHQRSMRWWETLFSLLPASGAHKGENRATNQVLWQNEKKKSCECSLCSRQPSNAACRRKICVWC